MVRGSNIIRSVSLPGLVLILGLAPIAAGAQVQFVRNAPGNPDENVLFQAQPQTGNPVFGVTNQTQQLVRFQGLETLNAADAQGQAVLKAADGALSFVCVDLDVAGNSKKFFTELEFLADMNHQTGTISFTADYVGGSATGQLSLKQATGQNRFNIIADPGVLLTKVCFSTTPDMARALQFRISGVQGGPPDIDEVPEPGTLALLAGGGLPLLGFLRRRR